MKRRLVFLLFLTCKSLSMIIFSQIMLFRIPQITSPRTERRVTRNSRATYASNHQGIGHNLPQEAAEAFAKAVVEVDGH